MFKEIANIGYSAARSLGKIGSVANDVDNITKMRFDKVAAKHVKKLAHKDLNKLMNDGMKMFK